jgi:hypothetical protein
MQRFRSTWLALAGGALLIVLSVSAALGAAPAHTREATRGQTIAAFVHELVFGADEAPEDEAELEEEELDQEDADALLDPVELDEELEDEVTEEADAHGECVSEVAQDPEAIGGENENHGGAVTEAARVTCWEPAENPELADPEADGEEDLEEADAHGACVAAVAEDKTAVGGKNGNHGGAVSEAARETCPAGAEEDEAALDEGDDELDDAQVEADKEAAKAEKKAAKEAARTDQGGGKPTWAGTGGNGGNASAGNAKGNSGGGNGRGGGRP